MNKIATLAATILLALLLLGCKEDTEETKLKKEYKKKFDAPISDFELSIERVEYYYWDNKYNADLNMSITRTATGAVAKYMIKSYGPEYELKLDTQEWLDFVNTLHKLIKVTGGRDTIKSDVMLYLNDKWELDNTICCF